VKLIEVKVDAVTAWLVNEQGETIFSRVFSRQDKRWLTYLHDRDGGKHEVEAARESRIVPCSELPHLKLGVVSGTDDDEVDGWAELEVIQPLAWRMSFEVTPHLEEPSSWSINGCECALRPIMLPPMYGQGINPQNTLLLDEREGQAHRFSDDWTPCAPESVIKAVQIALERESLGPPGSLRCTGLGLGGKWADENMADDEGAARAEG
jgi:hypothetical protein